MIGVEKAWESRSQVQLHPSARHADETDVCPSPWPEASICRRCMLGTSIFGRRPEAAQDLTQRMPWDGMR